MKAVGYQQSLPITDPQSLVDFETSIPQPQPHDLLVRVQAISVNPVDTKVRMRKSANPGEHIILGWDAAGIVEETGPGCTLFKKGDEVFYAGALNRPGTNAQFHLVDERLVGRKPRTLDFAQAAAMPLTSVTAWELLFDRLQARPGKAYDRHTILITGSAGGVGSMLIQLVRRLTPHQVVGTASRRPSRAWSLNLGAHAVIDHHKPFKPQLEEAGFPDIDFIASLTGTEKNFPELANVIAPQGHIAVIDDPTHIDVTLLKQKSAALHWEFMFTRSSFKTDDMIAQHHILQEISSLVDANILRTTMNKNLGPINAANLREAHRLIELGTTVGKIVLEGF